MFAVTFGVCSIQVGSVSAQDALARITSPLPGANVREIVVVTGTALHPRFKFYKVEYAVEPGANWVVIGDIHQNQVQDGVLVQWDTRAVPDGSYSLRLSVVDETGNFIEYIVRQIVVANTIAAPTETVTGTTTTTATPDTPTPTATSLGPTATVSIELPLLESPTPVATNTRSMAVLPTSAVPTPDTGQDSIGDTIRSMVGGVVSEVIGALGIDFGGLGSAFWRGAVLALGAFLAIGALALIRSILVGIYHLIRR
ncbi:MAG: hypothetical protein ACUVWR_08845 [Anaerolineae bacterium]